MNQKNQFKDDPETEFLAGLIELQYGMDVENKLIPLSKNISWAKGWPENNVSFWNAEAFMWNRKISKDKRNLIHQELNILEGGNNLDLGCGSFSYVPSTGFDFSLKMLDFNDNCLNKVKGDLEEQLPFSNNEFDSVTAIFVLNYVNNYLELLQEVCRVLSKNGTFVMVLYSKNLNEWQKRKQVNSFSTNGWLGHLNKQFTVNFYEKDKLLFFKCKKKEK